ncbi:MAG: TPM domain-containing protein [Betaproteobacteria bacterium]
MRNSRRVRRTSLVLAVVLLAQLLILVGTAPGQAAPGRTGFGEVKLLPTPATGRVADEAGILSDEAVARLNAILAGVEEQNGVEIGVATVPTTAPLTPDQYATELFEAWGVGKKGADNGLLILVALRERRIKVEAGYGLEGIFNDGRVGRLLDDFALPALRQGRYGDGLVALVGEMARIAEAEYQPGAGAGRGGSVPGRGPSASLAGFLGFLLILGLFLLVALAMRRPVAHRCPRCKGRMVKESEETLQPPTDEADGLARVSYRCTRCGFERLAEIVLPMLVTGELIDQRRRFHGPFGPFGGGGFGGFGGGGSGGGGFGGFGGGSSGGGGAGRNF